MKLLYYLYHHILASVYHRRLQLISKGVVSFMYGHLHLQLVESRTSTYETALRLSNSIDHLFVGVSIYVSTTTCAGVLLTFF